MARAGDGFPAGWVVSQDMGGKCYAEKKHGGEVFTPRGGRDHVLDIAEALERQWAEEADAEAAEEAARQQEQFERNQSQRPPWAVERETSS